jgi:hypothetical protein
MGAVEAAALTAAFMAASQATGVSPELLSSLCYQESRHDIYAYVPHDGGSPSYGMCQVKLATARALGFTGRADLLMEPSRNALYASLYLSSQHRRFGTWERAVSSYNAGHPISGNKRYVKNVVGGWNEFRRWQLLQMH